MQDERERFRSFFCTGFSPMFDILYGLMESSSLLRILIKFLRDFCGAKMLLLQSQDTTDALTCLWRLKLTKLQENMTTPLLITRWNFKGMSEPKLPITSDVPEGCTIIREHIPITNLFTCLWFNEVDDFTSRDQLSLFTVRDKIRARVDWSVNMFLDCERCNFVKQAYHRVVFEQMAPPAANAQLPIRLPVAGNVTGSNPVRRRRGKKYKNSGSKRHQKVSAGNKTSNISF